MRTLLYACSVYQLFNAINIRLNLLKDDTVDILLSDILPNQEKFAKNLEKSGVFEKVYTTSGKFIARQEYKHTRWNVYYYKIFPDLLLKQVGLNINVKYDRFYFATFDEFISYTYLKLHKLNKDLEVAYYEDGGATYMQTHQCLNVVEERLYNIFNIKPLGMIHIPVYVYEPDLMTFDCGADVKQIPKINQNDSDFKNAINTIFDFSSAPNVENKYIFFEESYLADGLKNNDEELINKCNEISNNDLILKPHPRNPYNRFENSTIKIFKTNIPWEVFCLNVNLSDKVLITVNSNATISPHILFDNAPKSILLYNLLVGQSNLIGKPEYAEYYNRILKLFPNSIFAPKSFEELEELL